VSAAHYIGCSLEEHNDRILDFTVEEIVKFPNPTLTQAAALSRPSHGRHTEA
jgi:hypothetical protein